MPQLAGRDNSAPGLERPDVAHRALAAAAAAAALLLAVGGGGGGALRLALRWRHLRRHLAWRGRGGGGGRGEKLWAGQGQQGRGGRPRGWAAGLLGQVTPSQRRGLYLPLRRHR
eukprot:SAG31_NODE_6361_length_2040_cov_31.247942_2_plen_114_part_00